MTVGLASPVGTSPAVTSVQTNSYAGSSKSSSELASSPNPTRNKAPETKENSTERKNDEVLSSTDKRFISQLAASDKRVKAHELAHLLAAGGYARGGPSYQYRQGPDGKKYAVAGEVQIDAGKEGGAARTIAKMRIVHRAALAPVDPSAQDRRVAAQAVRNIVLASQEMRLEEMSAEKAKAAEDADDKDKTNGLSGSGDASTKGQGDGVVTSALASQKGSTAYASAVGDVQDSSMLNLFA